MLYLISTIQDHIDFDYEITAYCARRWPLCSHSDKLDLKALRKRFGPDYKIEANSPLTRSLVCRKCGHKGGELRLSARFTSREQARTALEEGMLERFVARPDHDHGGGRWMVYDRVKETVFVNEDGPQNDLDQKEARELADILNDPESFYAEERH